MNKAVEPKPVKNRRGVTTIDTGVPVTDLVMWSKLKFAAHLAFGDGTPFVAEA